MNKKIQKEETNYKMILQTGRYTFGAKEFLWKYTM